MSTDREIAQQDAITLLREGVAGFSRVLVQTSDQERVYDWLKRARYALKRLDAIAAAEIGRTK